MTKEVVEGGLAEWNLGVCIFRYVSELIKDDELRARQRPHISTGEKIALTVTDEDGTTTDVSAPTTPKSKDD